jgi:predicted acetyltransferase
VADLISKIDIKMATADERPALKNMLQLYIHDFSEVLGERQETELGADGLYPDYPLDAYWRETTHIPLVMRVGGRLAGFALLNAAQHAGRSVERNMGEFFIARRYRRSGLGTLAARTIFSRYPGQWEVAIARRNTSALPFWRQVITHHPDSREIEEMDVTSPAWNGPLFRFRI